VLFFATRVIFVKITGGGEAVRELVGHLQRRRCPGHGRRPAASGTMSGWRWGWRGQPRVRLASPVQGVGARLAAALSPRLLGVLC
jgi:hypothetical protein